jgi:hypothetical protein
VLCFVQDFHSAEANASRLLRGINFVSHACFFNPARIDPAILSNQNGRLCIGQTRQTAVFITTGAVASCHLVQSVSAGFGTSTYRVKNISIFPFHQEYVRSVCCLGNALGVKTMHGPISAGAFTCSTRKEGSGKSLLPCCYTTTISSYRS